MFALNRIDVLENCEALTNLVVPDTVLRYLNRKSIQSFHGLRNTMEMASGGSGRYEADDDEANSRKFHYMYNENFVETYLDEERDALAKEVLSGRGLDDKLRVKCALVLSFYLKHFMGMTKENKVLLITSDSASKRCYLDIINSKLMQKHLGKQAAEVAPSAVVTLNEFVQMHRTVHPELANFEGFLDEAMSDMDFMS